MAPTATTHDPFGTKILLAGVSNMSAACITNPIDVIKVRMQLEGALTSKSIPVHLREYPGFITGGQRIFQREGMRGLYKGLLASLCREGSYSALRLGCYDSVKEALTLMLHKSTSSDDHENSLAIKISAGAMTGAAASALANPTDLLKIRMQAQARNTASSSYLELAQGLVGEGRGIRALWTTGVQPTVQRAALLTATQISSYDHAKFLMLTHTDIALHPKILLHLVCSMFAGFMAATITSPVDVIKTRRMNNVNASHASGGTLDAGLAIIRTEGFAGLYKGWFANWMRIGPHTVATLMIYEQLRAAAGLSPL